MPRLPRGDGIKRAPQRSVPVAFIACLGLAACLCTSCSSSAAAPPTLTVVAPDALRAPFLALRPAVLGRHPGWDVNFDFVADVQPSVVTAASADVAVTGDDLAMTQLVDSNVVQGPRRLAHDVLEIAFLSGKRPGAPTPSLADLSRRGARVAVVDPSVPTGAQTVHVLSAANVHLTTLAAANAQAAMNLVVAGAVDAALIEASDFSAGPPGLSAVPVTPVGVAQVNYQVAVVKDSGHLSAAQTLAGELLGPGQAALRDAGFLSP
jgi:ABC-type molybdate transport system substrate-binding protein